MRTITHKRDMQPWVIDHDKRPQHVHVPLDGMESCHHGKEVLALGQAEYPSNALDRGNRDFGWSQSGRIDPDSPDPGHPRRFH